MSAEPVPQAVRPRTIARLAHVIVADASPVDLPVLGVAMSAYFEVPGARRRMAKTIVGSRWLRHQTPTAFDSELGSLAPQLTLIVLNGVASGAFRLDDTGRWRRRRLDARLTRSVAADGAETAVPVPSPAEAERITRACHRLALRAGLSTLDAGRFTELLVAQLLGAV